MPYYFDSQDLQVEFAWMCVCQPLQEVAESLGLSPLAVLRAVTEAIRQEAADGLDRANFGERLAQRVWVILELDEP